MNRDLKISKYTTDRSKRSATLKPLKLKSEASSERVKVNAVKALDIPAKWGNSHTIQSGLNIQTKLAAASLISYPDLSEKRKKMHAAVPNLKKLPSISTMKSHHIEDVVNELSIRAQDLILNNQIQNSMKMELAFQRPVSFEPKSGSLQRLISFSKEQMVNEPCICITNSYHSNRIYSIPIIIAFKSSTLRHIHECSRKIFKSLENRCIQRTRKSKIQNDTSFYN
jgi:hypothetical protein